MGGAEIRFLVKYREIAIQNIIVESQFFGGDILYSKVRRYNTLCISMGQNQVSLIEISILGVLYSEDSLCVVVYVYIRSEGRTVCGSEAGHDSRSAEIQTVFFWSSVLLL